MNWKGGFLRIWLVVSASWIVLVIVHGYRPPEMSKLESLRADLKFDDCEKQRKLNYREGDDPFKCFPDIAPAAMPWLFGGATWYEIDWYLEVALVPPIALFAVGIVGVWMASGFRIAKP